MCKVGFQRGGRVISVSPSACAPNNKIEHYMASGALPEVAWAIRLAALESSKMLGGLAGAAAPLMP